MAHEPSGIDQARLNVIAFKPRVLPKEVINGIPCRQHAEDVLDRQTTTPDNRLAAEDFRIHGNPREEGIFLARCHGGCPSKHSTEILADVSRF
jgi:hypothetical protein